MAANLYIFLKRDNGYEFLNQQSYQNLYSLCDSGTDCYQKWYEKMNFYPENEIIEGAKFTSSEFGVQQPDSTLVKLFKIMRPLHQLYITNQKPQNKQDFKTLNPLQQYLFLKNNSCEASESYYTSMLHYFARCSNILIRHVHSTGHVNEHVFNEIYLAEKKQWIYTDVSKGILAVRKKSDGKYLNAADIMDAVEKKNLPDTEINFPDSTMGIYKKSDSADNFFNYYFSGSDVLYYYYTTYLSKVYKTGHKLKHYFTRFSWYETYTYRKISNTKFYVKQAAAAMALLSFAVFVFLLFRYKYLSAIAKKP
jgi:hypothetical protein